MSTQLSLPIPSKAEEVTLTPEEEKDELMVRYFGRKVPATPHGRKVLKAITPAQHTAVYRHKPNPSITLT